MYNKAISTILFFILCNLTYAQENSPTTVDSLQQIDRTSIYFDTDKYNLKKSERNKLDSLIKRISQYEKLSFIINGYADLRGSSSHNLKLSKNRANTIKEYLQSTKINYQKLETNYFGENRTKNSSLREQRRVDIISLADRDFLLISGKVLGKDNKILPEAAILYNSKTVNDTTLTDDEGRFKFYAPAGEDVEITAIAKDYFYVVRDVKAEDIYTFDNINFLLPSLEMNRKFIAQDLLFWGNRSTLLPQSVLEIDRLQRLMNFNDEYCFEIAGHINLPNRDSAEINTFHYNLSVARAQAIYDSMLHYGVDEERLYLKAYANWQMRFPHATGHKRQQANRRVEIIVRPCEEVKRTENDTLNVKRDYSLTPSKEKFSDIYLENDLEYFSDKARDKIISNVKYLKSVGRDPYSFTYNELIRFKPNK